MCIALEELGLTDCFDAVYGTSGGALNGARLLAGEGQRWLPSWASAEAAAAGVVDPRRVLRGGPLADLHVMVGRIYEEVAPMDFEAILANPITFHPIATDAQTGQAVDLAPYLTDRRSLQTALRATACLPLLAGPPVQIAGRSFVDGGIAEAIPWPSAVAHGATHALILRTRREGQMPTGDHDLSAWRWRGTSYVMHPGAGRSHQDRHLRYRDIDTATSSGARVMQIRPPDAAHDVSRLSKSRASITQAIEIGTTTTREALEFQVLSQRTDGGLLRK